eukprot:937045-Prymnesium_polylepis.1
MCIRDSEKHAIQTIQAAGRKRSLSRSRIVPKRGPKMTPSAAAPPPSGISAHAVASAPPLPPYTPAPPPPQLLAAAAVGGAPPDALQRTATTEEAAQIALELHRAQVGRVATGELSC